MSSAALLSLLIFITAFVAVAGDERVISSMGDFDSFRNAMAESENNDTVSLECDLDFTGMTGLMPLGVTNDGSTVYPFKGVFNGNNHWIHGLKIDTVGKPCDVAGFFGHIDGANISDLKFDEHCEFIGIRAGSVAGLQNNFRVTALVNIDNYGKVEGEHSGGLIGYVDSTTYKNFTIYTKCRNHGEVIAEVKNAQYEMTLSAGGIIGSMTHGGRNDENTEAYYTYCSNDGAVTVHVRGVPDTVQQLTCRSGGIVGGHDWFAFGDSVMRFCNNSGPVSVTVDDSTPTNLLYYVAAAGGLFGLSNAYSSTNAAIYSINMGNVTVDNYPPTTQSMSYGLFAGGIGGYFALTNMDRVCENTVNLGNVTCIGGTASGFDNGQYDITETRTFAIRNSGNFGRVTGAKAYGISSMEAIEADNVVSMGEIVGTSVANAMYPTPPSGSGTEQSTLFVKSGCGASDESSYKTFDVDGNGVCIYKDQKVADILNVKRLIYNRFIWPDVLRRQGFIIQFYGAYNSSAFEVEPDTHLSDFVVDPKYHVFFEDGSIGTETSTITFDVKFIVGVTRVISNMNQFNEFRSAIANCDNGDIISLECDLDFTGVTGLMPLGVSDDGSTMRSFKGVFKGNNHWIRGLKIDTVGKSCGVAGFFGSIFCANISDLKFDENCEFTGVYAGSVAGLQISNGMSVLLNIDNYGKVEGEHSGGMVGSMDSTTYKAYARYTKCRNHGEIIAEVKNAQSSMTLSAGGIVGSLLHAEYNYENTETYYNYCSNDGAVTVHVRGVTDTLQGLTCRSGGIVGGHDLLYGGLYMRFCNNSGPVSVTVDDSTTNLVYYVAVAGGLFGFCNTYSSTNAAIYSINMGNVTVDNYPPTTQQQMQHYLFASGISGYFALFDIDRTCENTVNLGNVTCVRGVASGLDNGQYNSTYSHTFAIRNSGNFGKVTGAVAYGISGMEAMEADNVVSMGEVVGTSLVKALYPTPPPGSSTEQSTLFVKSNCGAPDESSYKTFDVDGNGVCMYQDKKVSDILNVKRPAYNGFIWPDVLRRQGFILQFNGTFNHTYDVEPDTLLSDFVDPTFHVYLENGDEVIDDVVVEHDLKLLVLKKVVNVSVTVVMNSTENADQNKIRSTLEEYFPNCRIFVEIIDGTTISITMSTEAGTEQDVVDQLKYRQQECTSILCYIAKIEILLELSDSGSVKLLVDFVAMAVFVISWFIAF